MASLGPKGLPRRQFLDFYFFFLSFWFCFLRFLRSYFIGLSLNQPTIQEKPGAGAQTLGPRPASNRSALLAGLALGSRNEEETWAAGGGGGHYPGEENGERGGARQGASQIYYFLKFQTLRAAGEGVFSVWIS